MMIGIDSSSETTSSFQTLAPGTGGQFLNALSAGNVVVGTGRSFGRVGFETNVNVLG